MKVKPSARRSSLTPATLFHRHRECRGNGWSITQFWRWKLQEGVESKAFAIVLCLEFGTGVQHRTLRGEDQGWHVQAELAQSGKHWIWRPIGQRRSLLVIFQVEKNTKESWAFRVRVDACLVNPPLSSPHNIYIWSPRASYHHRKPTWSEMVPVTQWKCWDGLDLILVSIICSLYEFGH